MESSSYCSLHNGEIIRRNQPIWASGEASNVARTWRAASGIVVGHSFFTFATRDAEQEGGRGLADVLWRPSEPLLGGDRRRRQGAPAGRWGGLPPGPRRNWPDQSVTEGSARLGLRASRQRWGARTTPDRAEPSSRPGPACLASPAQDQGPARADHELDRPDDPRAEVFGSEELPRAEDRLDAHGRRRAGGCSGRRPGPKSPTRRRPLRP